MTGRFLKMLCQLILSPANGWHDVSHEGAEPSALFSAGYLPLAGAAAFAVFLQGLYHPGLGFVFLLQKAIEIFVQFFISYYIAQFFFCSFAGKYTDVAPGAKKMHTYIIFSLSLLALAVLVENCTPVKLYVPQFFSIYIAIIMWRGCRYMAVRPDLTRWFMLMALGSILLPPYILGFIFDIIVPSPY